MQRVTVLGLCVCLSVWLAVSLSACLLVLIYHLEQLHVQQEVLMGKRKKGVSRQLLC